MNYPPPTPIISAGGRKLYRHSSGMGTVMEYNDGVDRKVLVLDAQYRGKNLTLDNSDVDRSLTNYKGNETEINSTMTETELNGVVNDTNTSKLNTDVWVTETTSNAANHCRSVTVNGVGCDLPSINVLMRIWCERETLDSLDPTVTNNTTKQLSYNPELYVWRSSTDASRYYAWVVTFFSWGGGDSAIVGCETYGDKSTDYDSLIIPVLELE